MISGPNSPKLNSLNYQAWGNAGVLTKPATEAKTSFRVLQDAQLSQRDRAAGCVIVFAKSRTPLELGDNDLRTL